MRQIAALAAAYDISVIQHSGGGRDGVHFIMATTNIPWAELFMPAPGAFCMREGRGIRTVSEPDDGPPRGVGANELRRH